MYCMFLKLDTKMNGEETGSGDKSETVNLESVCESPCSEEISVNETVTRSVSAKYSL